MIQLEFFSYRVEINPELTAAGFAQEEPVNPACCNACATWARIAETEALPAAFLTFARDAGLDLYRPAEVWGAPDAGFLEGWFVVGGAIVSGEWNGGGENAYVELEDGLKVWMSKQLSMEAKPALRGKPAFEVAFIWESPTLREIEALAWPARS